MRRGARIPLMRRPTSAMYRTLHGYFLRELLKTFALATVALTGLLTMGGALFNVLRFEGLATSDVPLLTPILLPAMLTIAMPVAALFAATLTYGRFASDNEITACRAAGINVHNLLFAALLLAMFVALVALFGANILIPRIYGAIERYARNNLGVVAATKLESKSFIDIAKAGRDSRLLTCARVERPRAEELAARGFDVDSRITYLLIYEPRYLERSADDQLKRFVCGKLGFCQFDAREDPMRLTVTVKDVYDYEPDGGSVYLAEQTIGPFQFKFNTKLRPSFADLATLIRWLREPWQGGDVRDDYRRFRHDLERVELYRDVQQKIRRGEKLDFVDDLKSRFRLEASAATINEQQQVVLENVRVETIRADDAPIAIYEAQRANLFAMLPSGNDFFANSAGRDAIDVRIRLLETAEKPVLQIDPRATTGPQERSTTTFERLEVPSAIQERAAALPATAVLDPAESLELPENLAKARETLITKATKLRYRVISLINFRFALALSVLVTELIAATLGVGFRGSQMLSAFGLSCIPGGAAAILVFLGQTTADRPQTHEIGLWIMWGGLAAITLMQLILMRLLIRR